MKTEEIKYLFDKFESIACEYHGVECCSALLPAISIKAKDFAAEMTSVNVLRKDLHQKTAFERECIYNDKAVRDMLLRRGIVLEQLQLARMSRR